MANESKLILLKDDTGKVTGEIPWQSSTKSHRIGIISDTEYTLSVPKNAYRAHFIPSPGLVIWIGWGNTPLTAAIEEEWDTISGELNPGIRPMVDPDGNKINTLRFISENDGFLNVIFYAKNGSE